MDLKRRITSRVIAAVGGSLLTLTFLAVAFGTSDSSCAGCHASPSRTIARTSHSALKCLDCHLQNGAWGYPSAVSAFAFRMLPARIAGKNPAHATKAMSVTTCLQCHSAVEASRRVSTRNALRIRHDTCVPEAQGCQHCHGAEIHGVEKRVVGGPSMAECVRCHDSKGVDTGCMSCHTRNLREEPTVSRTSFSITHGPAWLTTHGMGDIASCRNCHQSGSCAQCHGVDVPHPADFGGTHGSSALQRGSDCLRCHEQKSCNDCHGIRMPHASDYLRHHATEATSLSNPLCQRCHDMVDCERCHRRHIHPGAARGVPVPPPPPAVVQ